MLAWAAGVPWRIHVEPLTRPLFFAWSRLTRGKTLGVRAVATDAGGRVLLVRHTYTPGWHFPGGGVEKGETAVLSMQRELKEEAGIEAAASAIRLLSVG